MAYEDYRVRLWEASGERHWWQVEFRTLKPIRGQTQYGHCDLDTRTITINCRLRSPDIVWLTILHETNHVGLGINASEDAVRHIEQNFEDAIRRLKRED